MPCHPLRCSSIPNTAHIQTQIPALPCPAPCFVPQTDLASQAELAAIERELRGINAEAGITHCQRCQIDLSAILNTGLYSAGMRPPAGGEPGSGNGGSGEGLQGAEAAAGSAARAAEAGTGAAAAAAGGRRGAGTGSDGQQQQQQQHCSDPQCDDPEHHHQQQQQPCTNPQCSDPEHPHHHSHQHDARVGTVTISLPGAPLDLSRLRHWLDCLLWEGTADSADLFRIKGLLHVAGTGSSRKHILQGVHEIYDIVEGPEWAPGEQRGSKVVFIGRRLRRDALAADLAACQLAPAEADADAEA